MKAAWAMIAALAIGAEPLSDPWSVRQAGVALDVAEQAWIWNNSFGASASRSR